MQSTERRTELASFLRTRRTQLSLEQVGLASGRRRRTLGLRREEVAQLADVSVEWYTRLEQGRDIQVSSRTLEQIAAALLLNADERVHLFHLAGKGFSTDQLSPEEVSPSLQRYLDALGNNPAYGASALRVVVYTPLDEENTSRKLEQLLRVQRG